MPGFDLTEFTAKGLIYGGARPSKFTVECNIPPAIIGIVDPTSAEKITFTCKSASTPGFILGMAPIYYFGRQIKLAGDRVFEEWPISIYLDEDYNTKAFFEVWQNSINSIKSNVMTPADDTSTISAITNNMEAGYKTDWTVTHYGQDGETIRQYIINGIWPRVLGPIGLDWQETNRVIVFPVTMCYDMAYPSTQGEGFKGNQSLYATNL